MINIKHAGTILTFAALLSFSISACTTDPYTGEKKAARTGIGAGAGAAIGAAAGAIFGGGKGAAIGAGVGALSGAAVGGYMDSQESKLRRQLEGTGVSVTRDGDNIVLNMPGNITFASASSTLSPRFTETLDSVAMVLKEYDKTMIDIVGHTDSTGSDALNLRLSGERAMSVGTYLTAKGIAHERMVTRGMGENMPVATNETPEGRAINRRVELALVPVVQ